MTLPVPDYMQLVCSSSVDYLDCVQNVQEVWSSVERWRPEACRSPHWIPQAKASVSTSCTRNTSYPEAVVERFYFDHLDDFVNWFWWKNICKKYDTLFSFGQSHCFAIFQVNPSDLHCRITYIYIFPTTCQRQLIGIGEKWRKKMRKVSKDRQIDKGAQEVTFLSEMTKN